MSSRSASPPVRRRLSRVYLNQRPRISTGGGRRARKQRETSRRTAMLCVAVLFVSAALVFALLAMDRGRGIATGHNGVFGSGGVHAAAPAKRPPPQAMVRLQDTWQQLKAQWQP